MSPRFSALLFAVPLGLWGLGALPVPASAQDTAPTIYKWVDQQGIAHYTTDPERIPSSLRNRVRDLNGDAVTTDSERWAVRDTPPRAIEVPAVAVDGGPPIPRLSPADAEQIAAIEDEIAGLEIEIAEDEATLVEMLSRAEAVPPLSEDPDFREIAKRLPRLEEELRALRDRRAALQGTRTRTP